MDTVIENLGGDLVNRDAKPLERLHNVPGPVKIFFETGAQFPVLSKGVHRGWRHGVDGVRADQLLDIEHIAVFWVFVPVLAQSSRCVGAPFARKASQRGPAKSRL